MTTTDHTTRLTNAANDLTKARNAYADAITTANRNGLSTRTIGTILGVSHQTIWNIVKNQRTTTR